MARAATAVVIAAGAGSRLREGNGDLVKPATPVLGVPILIRTLRRLADAGVRRAVVVTGCRADEIRALLRRELAGPGLEVILAHNEDWRRQNGLSVLAAREHVDGAPFFLTMADHVYSRLLLDALRAVREDHIALALAVDRRLREVGDLDDAVRVRAGRGGRISDIGKGLEPYDAVDTGVFLCTPALLGALEAERDERGGDCSLSDGVRRIALGGRALAVEIPGEAWWQDIDTPADLARAERKLRDHEVVAELVPR